MGTRFLCGPALVPSFFPGRFYESCRSPRLQKPELRLGQFPLSEVLFLGVFLEIKPFKNRAVLRGHGPKNATHGLQLPSKRRRVLRPTVTLRRLADMGRYLCPYDVQHMAHQPVRAARLAPLQRLHHHAKSQVNSVLQILLSQLSREKEPDSLRDYPVQFLYRRFLAAANSLH